MNTFTPETFFDLIDFPFKDLFLGIENVWEVLPKMDEFIHKQFKNGDIKGNYKENIYIGEGTMVHETALIVGPALIGKNVTIAHGSYIRGGCIIGDNINVGHGSEIKHTVLLNNSKVPHLNYVCDSIVGNKVNFGVGAVVANYRLDKQPIRIKMNGETIETGLRKLGAILGDNSSIGANAVLNPGTILGKGAIVYPLTSVTGVYEHEAVIR